MNFPRLIILLPLFIWGCHKPAECILDPEKATIEINDTSLYFKSITIYADYKNGEDKMYNLDFTETVYHSKISLDSILYNYNTTFSQQINSDLISMSFTVVFITKAESFFIIRRGIFFNEPENRHRILKLDLRA
jgi:hypothetical protein